MARSSLVQLSFLALVLVSCVARHAAAQDLDVPATPQPGSWEAFEAQSDAAGGAVPAATVLDPNATPRLAMVEARRFFSSVQMRDAAEARVSSLDLVLASLVTTIAVGALVPAAGFATGLGPCIDRRCRYLEQSLYVAGGISLGFAILAVHFIQQSNTALDYADELRGDSAALTQEIRIHHAGVRYENSEHPDYDARLAERAHELDRLLVTREHTRIEGPALWLGISAGAATVFGTYSILFAATADDARPRKVETPLFAALSGVSLAVAAISFIALENALSDRKALSAEIAVKRDDLEHALPAE